MIQTVKHYIVKPTGDEKESIIANFSNNLPSIDKWSPVVMLQAGSINGADLLGNTWRNYTFTTGWNFSGMVYDVPTVGKATYECYATTQSSVVWYAI